MINLFKTSPYGKRKLFSRFHKGCDYRTWTNDKTKRLKITLPIECVYDHTTVQKRWGNSHIFLPTSGPADKIMFTHLTDVDFYPGQILKKGTVIGESVLTDYMRKNVKKLGGEHLHFECESDGKHFDPDIFMNYLKATK